MKKFLFLVLLLMACQSKNTNIETLRDGFQTPPATARPGVYWYFMDGNFSREGVTKDLEAMKRAGIGYVIFLEENVVDYPDWATRELVMNAICHRDYESNGPIQFYQYADRIEIENHGGLYGRANEQNFPNVNDYRNLIVAEGMKVLGFVNRQSRGVLKVQRELRENENGEAIYDFGYDPILICHLICNRLKWYQIYRCIIVIQKNIYIRFPGCTVYSNVETRDNGMRRKSETICNK